MPNESTYTVKEAAALAGSSERVIRNEIERGVIRVKRKARGRAAAVTLPRGAVLYFRLLKEMPVRLPRSDRSELYRLLAGRSATAGSWRYDRGRLRRGILTLDAKAAEDDLDHHLRAYEAGSRKVVSRPDILGGEPVFAGTRIAIRHVGGLALRGAPIEEIKLDFPSLNETDIAFAAVFSRMKPAPGRPAKLKFRRVAA